MVTNLQILPLIVMANMLMLEEQIIGKKVGSKDIISVIKNNQYSRFNKQCSNKKSSAFYLKFEY
jgi:hypothetical protein